MPYLTEFLEVQRSPPPCLHTFVPSNFHLDTSLCMSRAAGDDKARLATGQENKGTLGPTALVVDTQDVRPYSETYLL